MAPCAQHDVIMHAYHARAASALVNLYTWTRQASSCSWRKRSISGVTCVMELSHQPHRSTSPCFRGLDAGSPQWTEMVTTNTRSAAHARSEDHHFSCSGLIENPLAIMPRVDPHM